MPESLAVRLQVAQLVSALERACDLVAVEPPDPGLVAELTPLLLRAHGTALRVDAHLNEVPHAASEPGS